MAPSEGIEVRRSSRKGARLMYRERLILLILLGIAIVAAVGGIRFLTQAIEHFTGRP